MLPAASAQAPAPVLVPVRWPAGQARSGSAAVSHSLTRHGLAVELHLHDVGEQLVGHEGGAEALVAEGAHRAGHVAAVHQDLQVAGARAGPIDCEQQVSNVSTTLFYTVWIFFLFFVVVVVLDFSEPIAQ